MKTLPLLIFPVLLIAIAFAVLRASILAIRGKDQPRGTPLLWSSQVRNSEEDLVPEPAPLLV
ncbi:MAG: hypothetical protein Q4D96_13750 [Propionibacteriaceae bacterium]|nr:hypothetical protein [Propionibacteriaceae bacterium]